MPAEPTTPGAAPTAGAAVDASWDDIVRAVAKQHGVNPLLALAVAQKESSKDPNAVGDSGQAIGMFQLHAGAAQDTGVDRTVPLQNIVGGVKYLRQLSDRYNGDVTKMLHAYNGGMDNVDKGTVTPQAQAYAAEVMANLSAGLRQTAGGGTAAVPPPAVATPAATAPVGTPPPAARAVAPPNYTGARQFIGSTADDFIGGAKAQAAKVVYGGGDLIRRGAQKLGLPVERIVDKPDVQAAMTPPDSLAGRAGQFATETAEFAIPANAIGKTIKATQLAKTLINAGVNVNRARLVAASIEGGAQAAVAGGISALQGDDPTATAIISAATPVAATLVRSMAPAIRSAAATRMARFFERGIEGHITPEMEKTLAQSASDFIDLPLQRTWRQTAALTLKGRQAAGATLESALAGPLGDTPVPIQPILQGLDDLVADAQHVVPTGRGEFRTITFKPGITEAVGDLKSLLTEYGVAYGDAVPARQLHDLKQVWWKTVYPRKEAGQPIASLAEQLTSAQKEAHLRGAAEIMKVFEQRAPTISALDQAVSHAAKLDQLVKRISTRARVGTIAKPTTRYAVGAAGGAVGVGAGGALGHPIMGAHVGYGTTRLLMSAFESPKWRLLPIAARRNLANALARGDADRAKRLLLPVTQAIMNDDDNLLKQMPQREDATSFNAAR